MPASSFLRKQPAKTQTSRKKKEVDPYFARLCEVDDILQSRLDADYANGNNRHKLRFDEGDKIIVLSQGLYYAGLIRMYYRLATQAATASLFPAASPAPSVELRVPTCMVGFLGWPAPTSKSSSDEEMPENELIRRTVEDNPDADSVLGMLFAHHWNEYRREQLGHTEEGMGKGVWFLDEEGYSKLQDIWKAQTGETRSFAAFCCQPEKPAPNEVHVAVADSDTAVTPVPVSPVSATSRKPRAIALKSVGTSALPAKKGSPSMKTVSKKRPLSVPDEYASEEDEYASSESSSGSEAPKDRQSSESSTSRAAPDGNQICVDSFMADVAEHETGLPEGEESMSRASTSGCE